MEDADQYPRNDCNIRKIEHRPELEIDEIDDAITPHAIQDIAASPTECRAKSDLRDHTLEERLKLNDRNEKNKFSNPERYECRIALKKSPVDSLI